MADPARPASAAPTPWWLDVALILAAVGALLALDHRGAAPRWANELLGALVAVCSVHLVARVWRAGRRPPRA